jgi:hypothetical protein
MTHEDAISADLDAIKRVSKKRAIIQRIADRKYSSANPIYVDNSTIIDESAQHRIRTVMKDYALHLKDRENIIRRRLGLEEV